MFDSSLVSEDFRNLTGLDWEIVVCAVHRVDISIPMMSSTTTTTTSTDDSSRMVVAYVRRLVERTNPNAKESKKESVMRLCTRMLGSRLSPPIETRDPFYLTRKIRKHLNRSSSQSSSSSRNKSLIEAKIARFDSLARKATSNVVVHKKWASLYLLYALRDFGKVKSAYASAPLGSAIASSSLSSDSGDKKKIEPEDVVKSSAARKGEARRGAAAPSTTSPQHRRQFDWGLTHWRVDESTSFEDSEQVLLRDVIFALQGIDGIFLRYSRNQGRYVVKEGALSLPAPTRAFVETICEGGALYRRIKACLDRFGGIDAAILKDMASAAVSKSHRMTSCGRVRRSFCESIKDILAEYFRLLAVLEAQIAQTSLSSKKVSTKESATASVLPGRQASALTLRRLHVWLVEPLDRLRVLADLCESTASAEGGALASATFLHGQHGDASVQALVSEVMEALSAPIFEIMYKWVSDGVLDDPFEEFFVRLNDEANGWNERYVLVPQMVPRFLSMPLAKMILLLGKSIYFVRNCCHHARGDVAVAPSSVSTKTSSWQDMRKTHVRFDTECFKYGPQWDSGRLQRSIALASKTVNEQLVDMLFRQHKIMEHLFALKQYLLMGRGDFALCLMDAMQPELKARASSIFRHHLVSKLEHAIRSSSAQFDDPDVLKRLDVRLLEASPGEEGWDIFLLDYNIQKVAGIGSRSLTPLSAVITPDAMKSYHKVFTFLWQMKRVEHGLANRWKEHIAAAKSANEAGVGDSIRDVVHRCRILHHEMTHFVSNLHNYIMFEVLETSWEELAREMPAAKDLDSVIEAHETYLRKVLTKALIDREAEEVRGLLNKVFDLIVRFCKTEQRMYAAIVQATSALRRHSEESATTTTKKKNTRAKRKDESGRAILSRLKTKAPRLGLRRGVTDAAGGANADSWGLTPEMEAKSLARRRALQQQSNDFGKELNELQVDYTRHIRNLLFILREKYGRSENLQFLAFRLDFNLYYATAFGGGEEEEVGED